MAGSLDYLKVQLGELEAAGTALHPRTLQGEQRARTVFDGREVINLASNNYLGLAAHPRLKEAAARAARDLGAGSGAVRTIAGTMTLHRELEERFAAFKGAEASIMFQSGFTANSGTVAALLGKEDVIVSDQLNHASIIDGARLSRAEDGDIAPLDRLVEVAEAHGAIMMIDDAHASGVLGEKGKGTVSHYGLDPARVDVQVGTLSKAIGVLGGFIAGPRHLIDWLVNRGRPFLFSTSAPPPVAAACIEALKVIEEEPERLERLWSNTESFKKGLHDLGFDTGQSETPITPVIAGDEAAAVELARGLWDEGVFTPAIVFPTVPKGGSRVRTIVTAEHSEDDLREALGAFQRVGGRLGLI
jgi:glycine C-acetyltransferase